MTKRIMLLLLIQLMLSSCGYQDESDILFREYYWFNENGDAGQSLRVGGRFDYGGGDIVFPDSLDLKGAERAEIIVEKILCHGGTKGLSVNFNGKGWLTVPESDSIPEPQWDYQHHFFPTFDIPLEYLNPGNGNTFKVKVDTLHPWNWPQNLINGLHIRIYYDPVLKNYSKGKITVEENKISSNTNISLEIISNPENLKKVEYLGYFDGINWEGDGIYRKWHFIYDHGELKKHIGSSITKPFSINWNTEWLPDQNKEVKLKARLVDNSGMIYESNIIENLNLERDNYSVELCKPYNVSKHWVTRNKDKSQNILIKGDLSKVMDAVICWSSWCPCYMDGIYINEQKVFDFEGPCYQHYTHWIEVKNLKVLKEGENTISTGWKQKNEEGENIHGMEVNYPGIMLLLRYNK